MIEPRTTTTTRQFEIACPHACVNLLRLVVTQAADGSIVGFAFQGHAQTHSEWTGRPLVDAQEQGEASR